MCSLSVPLRQLCNYPKSVQPMPGIDPATFNMRGNHLTWYINVNEEVYRHYSKILTKHRIKPSISLLPFNYSTLCCTIYFYWCGLIKSIGSCRFIYSEGLLFPLEDRYVIRHTCHLVNELSQLQVFNTSDSIHSTHN